MLDKLTIPPFESKLPEDLLEGMSKRDRYLYAKLDEIGQAQTWLVYQAAKHHDKLEEVCVQTEETNGRLLTTEREIQQLKLVDDAAKPAIEMVQTAVRVGKSRWFWIGAAAFLSVGLPWLVVNAPAPIEVVRWAVALLIG